MNLFDFRKTLFLSSVALAALYACSTPSTLRIPDAELIERDKYNIISKTELGAVVDDQAAASNLIYKATQRGYKVITHDHLEGLKLHLIVFQVPPRMDPVKAIGELESLEAGTIAGVNHAYELQQTGDRRSSTPDSYANTTVNWPLHGCQSQEPIGVIDARMDERLALSYGVQLVQESFATGGSNRIGETEHGDQVLAVLAGDGRLHGPVIYSASVISESDTTKTGVVNIIQALDWLAKNDVKIVNVSLAGPYNKILDKGIRSADRTGMKIIAAAGNNGPSSPPRYPAAFPEVLAVTAVDANKKVFKRAVRGEHIDFAAPGVDVMIKVGDKLEFVTGTSFASPFLSSMLATNPTLLEHLDSPDELAQLGVVFEDLGDAGFDEVYGHGLLKFSWSCDP